MVTEMGQKLLDKSNDAFDVWNDAQCFDGQDLAQAYFEYLQVFFDLRVFQNIASNEKKNIHLKADTKESLTLLHHIGALYRMQKSIAHWYEHGYFTADHGEMIRASLKQKLGQFKKYAIPISEMLLPRNEMFDNMIAPNDADLYKSVQKFIYKAPQVFERTPVWRDILHTGKPKL